MTCCNHVVDNNDAQLSVLAGVGPGPLDRYHFCTSKRHGGPETISTHHRLHNKRPLRDDGARGDDEDVALGVFFSNAPLRWDRGY
jgi:hypothetical protein